MITEYKGITIKDYQACQKKYAKKMFKLFDSDRIYNSNLGDCLMWLGAFTSNYIACDVVDKHIEEKITLFDAFIECLKEECPEKAIHLEKIKNI